MKLSEIIMRIAIGSITFGLLYFEMKLRSLEKMQKKREQKKLYELAKELESRVSRWEKIKLGYILVVGLFYISAIILQSQGL